MFEKQNMDMGSKPVDYHTLSPESLSNAQINHFLLISLFLHISQWDMNQLIILILHSICLDCHTA